MIESSSDHSAKHRQSVPSEIHWSARKPLYFIIFDSPDRLDEVYLPFVPFADLSGTAPHGLDRSLVHSLRPLWYCLHLPAAALDFCDLSASTIKQHQKLDIGHEIILIPIQALRELLKAFESDLLKPAFAFSEDRVLRETKETFASRDYKIEIISFSEIEQTSLQQKWLQILEVLQIPEDQAKRPNAPLLNTRLDCAGIELPLKRMALQIPRSGKRRDSESMANFDGEISESLSMQAYVSGLAEMERKNFTSSQLAEHGRGIIRECFQSMKIPVSVSFPGLPTSYCAQAYNGKSSTHFSVNWSAVDEENTFDRLQPSIDDQLAERSCLEFLVSHRAIATSGIGISFKPIASNIFGKLSQIEDHYRRGANKPKYLWKVLKDVGSALAASLTPGECEVLGKASQITAFTNFPIGFTILPGDSSPLMCRVPISYRPILPLTRALQNELHSVPSLALSQYLRILLVETLDPSDRIRNVSFEGLKFIKEHFSKTGQVEIEIREARSVGELIEAIESVQPQVMLLSAHGGYDLDRNFAGIWIGDKLCLGPELGIMPPLVILSACHVAPRGTGAVNIAELLIRQGAIAVLGTQVPVEVQRNVQLMVRFFTYITAAISGLESLETVADAWHKASALNSIFDLLQSSNPSMRGWAYKRNGKESPIEKFMKESSKGRLRAGSIHDDSEDVLLEIAREDGVPAEWQDWIKSKAYTPETLFYFMMGRPERLRLSCPIFSPVK